MFRIDKTLVNISESPILQKNVAEPGSRAAEFGSGAAANAYREAEAKGLRAAAELAERAKDEARVLLQQAEIEAQALWNESWSRGYLDGKAEAEAEIARRMEEDAESLRDALSEIAQARAKALTELESEIIDLTLSMAKKIINFAEENDDKIFESMIVKAIKKMKTEGRITVRVSSAEYEKYFSSGSAAFVLGDETVSATVLEDPALRSWDCIIDTNGETVNAGLDSQLKYIQIAYSEMGES